MDNRTALPLWLLTLILFNMVPRYGGYFSIMTGASLLIGNIIWAAVRNPLELVFPMYFEGCREGVSDHTGCVMKLHYSWSFWLCLVTGRPTFITLNIVFSFPDALFKVQTKG